MTRNQNQLFQLVTEYKEQVNALIRPIKATEADKMIKTMDRIVAESSNRLELIQIIDEELAKVAIVAKQLQTKE